MAFDEKQKFNLKSLANIQGDINEHQKILAEIKVEEEVHNKKVKDAQWALIGIETQKEELEKKIQELTKVINEFISWIPGIMSEALKSLRQSNQILDKNIETLKQLGLKIEQEKINLGVVKEQQEKIHSQMLEENRVLSIRKSDLDVYQARVEEEYAKLLPNEKVIL